MAQTFAPGYQRPGVYVDVKYQPTVQVLTPPFITALIGRTSASKPATIELIRNAAIGNQVGLDAQGLVVVTADAEETNRRDYVGTYAEVANESGVLAMTSILDSLGAGHLKGSAETWMPYNEGTISTDHVYVEWVAKYYVTPAATGDMLFAGSMSSGQLVSIAGISQESQEVDSTAFTDQDTPITAADGDHDEGGTGGLVLTNTVGTYTLTWDGGVASTGFLPDTGVIEAVLSNAGTTESIKVLIDTSKLADLDLGAGETYTNNVQVSTAGPASGTSITAGTYSVSSHGVKYTVAYYEPKDSNDFVPTRFDDLNALQIAHGAITSSTGTDYLSLGAVAYFAYGGPVYAAPLKDKTITGVNTDPDLTNDSGYVEAVRLALVALESQVEVACVVVLSPTEPAGSGNFRPDILNYVKSHCTNMSSVANTKKCRMGILGAVANETNEAVFIAAAQAGGTNNLVYLAPSTATLNAGGYTFTVDGSTMAAGLAGILSRPDINAGEPISGKSFDMFSDVSDQFTETQKNRMAAAGVTIIEKQGGATKVRHFLSTDPSNVLLSEAKVTRIAIDYRRSLVQALEPVLINTRFIPGQTIGTAKSLIAQLSTLKVQNQIIVDYRIDKVAVNSIEPRQLDVEVSILPVLDLNWIYVKATFQTSLT